MARETTASMRNCIAALEEERDDLRRRLRDREDAERVLLALCDSLRDARTAPPLSRQWQDGWFAGGSPLSGAEFETVRETLAVAESVLSEHLERSGSPAVFAGAVESVCLAIRAFLDV